MERLQIIYNNGTNIVINACNGTYNAIMGELRKKRPAKYITPPAKSKYKYCISLNNITCIDKIEVGIENTVGFRE